MSWWKVGLATLVWTIVATAPAGAEHLTLAPEARPGARPEASPPPIPEVPAEAPPEARLPQRVAPSPDVRLDMKLGADGFRLGGSVSDERGTYGAWVNGRRAGRGIVVNGEVQTKAGTRSYSFALDADVLEAVARALARQWLFGD